MCHICFLHYLYIFGIILKLHKSSYYVFLFVYYFPVKQLAMFLTSFYLQACIIALSHVPSRIAPTIYVIYCVYMAFQNDRVESKGIACTRMLSYMQVKNKVV